MREMIKAFEFYGHEVLPVILGGISSNGVVYTHRKSRLKSFLKILIPKKVWRSLKDIKLQKMDRYAQALLEEQIAIFKPDLIYERGTYLQISGVNAAIKFGIPHFMEFNAPYVDESEIFEGAPSFFKAKANKFERKQLESSTKIVVVSSALKEYFVKKHKINPEKFIITPNCVDPEKLKVDLSLKKTILEKYNLEDKVILGFVGAIFPHHGVDILIESFGLIKREGELGNLKLLIVGGGEFLPGLKKLAAKLGISNDVVFTDSVIHSHVFSYIDIMDICVLPNTGYYMSPIKIFEYGAMGKAVIAPKVAPVEDVLTHGYEGILISPEVLSLKDAIEYLVRNPDDRKQIAQRFKVKVLENFVWTKMAYKILSQAFANK